MEQKQAKKQFQRKIVAAIICATIGLLTALISEIFLMPYYETTKANLAQTTSIAKKITAVEDQKRSYEAVLNESGKVYGNLVQNKDKYILYLGEITMANKLNINKMTVDDITKDESSPIYSMKVQIELQGDLYNVKNMVQQLYDSETVSRINSFSYRLQNTHNLMWMWRDIDDETLVPWWDIDAPNNTNITQGEEEEPLSVEDLLTHGPALCYLEVEFMGLAG